MRKQLIIILFFGISFALFGQEKQHALGIRYGTISPVAELTYQKFINKKHRIEIDLGISTYPVQATFIYQKVGSISDVLHGLKIYGGAGAMAGFFNNTMGIGLVAQAGVEYNIIPSLHLSMDYRPSMYLLNGNFDFKDLCLSLRYHF